MNKSDFPTKPLRVYLAGPDVFLRNAVEMGVRKKALCTKYGFEGTFPIDTELNIKGLSLREAGFCISASNEALIKSCDLIIANITPFRGPSADVGTAFEMGFARAIGLPVFAYSNVSLPFVERTKRFLKLEAKDIEGKFRDSHDMAIEEWGFTDNLMLDGCIQGSGGKLVLEDAPEGELFTYLAAFEKCLRMAQDTLKDKVQSKH
jgi:nucleoside 2-deoxyribosyltransferase